jgi:uncharacterized protein (DUF1697 family)
MFWCMRYLRFMTGYVAFLRGINVGGNKRIKMADLRRALENVGIDQPTTILQSGNVILESNADAEALIDIIETSIETSFGFHSDVIVRTKQEIERMVGNEPFDDGQLADPRMAHVMFMKSEPDPGAYHDLRAAYEGPEAMKLVGRDFFVHYPDGSGRSNLAGKTIEKALGVTGTARNWNTVTKIYQTITELPQGV